MALIGTVVEAVKNRKTQKYFIIIDDTLGTRYKLINPGGEIIVLPDMLFEEDPIQVPLERFLEHFTPEQQESLEQYQIKMAQLAEAELRRPLSAPVTTVAPPQATPSKPRRSAQPKPPPRSGKTGVGATWTSAMLTFYRSKIEPLGPKQSFKISVEGQGEFTITKEEFATHFNDVVMSSKYNREGWFTYPEIPEKARRYFR